LTNNGNTEDFFRDAVKILQQFGIKRATDFVFESLYENLNDEEDIAKILLIVSQYSWEANLFDFSEALINREVSLLKNKSAKYEPLIEKSLRWLAVQENSLAGRLALQNEYASSESYFLKALKTQLRAVGTEDADYAMVMGNLGSVVYFTQGEFDKSERYLVGAIRIFDKLNVLDDPVYTTRYTTPLMWLGRLFAKKGDFLRSRQYYKKALGLYYERKLENQVDYMIMLNELSSIIHKLQYGNTTIPQENSRGISRPTTLDKIREMLEHYQLKGIERSEITPAQIESGNKDYIRQINKFTDEHVMVISNVYLTDKDRRNLKKELKEIKPITKYEYLATFYLLSTCAKDIEETLVHDEIINYKNAKFPLFGTLMSLDLNAKAIPVEGTDDYLVLFETEIFTFCNLISKIIAKCLPVEKVEDKIVPNFRRNKKNILNLSRESKLEVYQRFFDLLSAFLFAKRATAAKQYFLADPFMTWASTLRTSMELFILSHEYSHVLLGHLSHAKILPSYLLDEPTTEIIYEQGKEYDADFYGMQLMLRTMIRNNEFNSLAYCGPELFFSLLEVIKEARQMVTNTPEDIDINSSHPPETLRRSHLRKAMRENFGQEYLDTSIFIENILKNLWDDGVKPFFEETFRKKG
jgi:hypothetical protein